MQEREKRSRKKEKLLVLFRWCAAGLAILLTVGCTRQDSRLQNLVQMEGAQGPVGEERIEELRQIIAEYEDVVNEKVQAAVHQASYQKLLAQAYMQQQLYGPALQTLEEAVFVEPQNQVLHQLAGVSAGYVAKAQGAEQAREQYFQIAERHYLRSIDLDPGYVAALYGLAVLYVFELDRPFDALAPLTRLLDESPSYVPGLFVLAHAHYALGNIDDAIAAYDQIIEKAPGREQRERAERNRQLLLGGN